jgi:hypothetical protein
MEPRRLAQAGVLVAVVAVGIFLILQVTDGWSSWVVLGFFVVGVYGGALAVDDTRHARRGRTFIRKYDD